MVQIQTRFDPSVKSGPQGSFTFAILVESAHWVVVTLWICFTRFVLDIMHRWGRGAACRWHWLVALYMPVDLCAANNVMCWFTFKVIFGATCLFQRLLAVCMYVYIHVCYTSPCKVDHHVPGHCTTELHEYSLLLWLRWSGASSRQLLDVNVGTDDLIMGGGIFARGPFFLAPSLEPDFSFCQTSRPDSFSVHSFIFQQIYTFGLRLISPPPLLTQGPIIFPEPPS